MSACENRQHNQLTALLCCCLTAVTSSMAEQADIMNLKSVLLPMSPQGQNPHIFISHDVPETRSRSTRCNSVPHCTSEILMSFTHRSICRMPAATQKQNGLSNPAVAIGLALSNWDGSLFIWAGPFPMITSKKGECLIVYVSVRM